MSEDSTHTYEILEATEALSATSSLLSSILGVSFKNLVEGSPKEKLRLKKLLFIIRTMIKHGVKKEHLLGVLDSPLHEVYDGENDDSIPCLLFQTMDDEIDQVGTWKQDLYTKIAVNTYRLEEKIRVLEGK